MSDLCRELDDAMKNGAKLALFLEVTEDEQEYLVISSALPSAYETVTGEPVVLLAVSQNNPGDKVMLEDLSLGVSRELIPDRSELLFTVLAVAKTIKPMLGYGLHEMLETSQKTTKALKMGSSGRFRSFRGVSMMGLGVALVSLAIGCTPPPSPAQRCVNMGVPPNGPAFVQCIQNEELLDQQAYSINAAYSAAMMHNAIMAITPPPPPPLLPIQQRPW